MTDRINIQFTIFHTFQLQMLSCFHIKHPIYQTNKLKKNSHFVGQHGHIHKHSFGFRIICK